MKCGNSGTLVDVKEFCDDLISGAGTWTQQGTGDSTTAMNRNTRCYAHLQSTVVETLERCALVRKLSHFDFRFPALRPFFILALVLHTTNSKLSQLLILNQHIIIIIIIIIIINIINNNITIISRLRVFKNRILRRIFGPKRDGNGEWRRLHNEEFHTFYRSPNIVSMIKSRRLRWAGHLARIEKVGVFSKFYR